MDEGEHDEADAFDFDHYVLVFAYALHVAFVAFEFSGGDADPLAGFEVFFAVDFAAGGVSGGQQAQQVDACRRYGLNPVVFGITVYPERYVLLGVLAPEAFLFQKIGGGGFDEEYPRYHRTQPFAFAVCAFRFFGEIQFFTQGGEFLLGAEFLTGADGEPFRRLFCFYGMLFHAWVLLSFLRDALLRASHHSQPSDCQLVPDSKDEPIQVLPMWLCFPMPRYGTWIALQRYEFLF